MDYQPVPALSTQTEAMKARIDALTTLFKTFRRSNKDYSELISVLAFVGLDLDYAKIERACYTPPAEQRKKYTKYKKALEAARTAFHEIPKGAFCNTDCYEEYEPMSVSREISQGKEGSYQKIEITRPIHMVAPDYWIAELDILTILIEDSAKLEESAKGLLKPDFFLPTIRRAALHCRAHGIKPSHSEDSRFYKIAATLLPHLSDPGPVIRKAIQTIQTDKKG